MKPTVLSLDCPKLVALMGDFPALQLWESLRRSPSDRSVQELATLSSATPEAAQDRLDRLVDAGMVVRLKARSTRRRITYRSVSKQLIVSWDRSKPEQFAALQALRRAQRKSVQEVLLRNAEHGLHGAVKLPWLEAAVALALTLEEASEIHAVLIGAMRAVDDIVVRVKARQGGSPASDDAGWPGPRLAEGESGYQLVLNMQPLAEPPPLGPEFMIWESGSVERALREIECVPSSLLSPREFEIAQRLAKGESRPTVATALGLSTNTVQTVTKRIYRKLGVTNRAMFTARMKGS